MRRLFRRMLPCCLCLALPAALAGCTDPAAPLNLATTVAEDRSMSQVAADSGIKLDFDRRLLDEKNRDLFFDLNCDVYEGRLMLTGSVKTAQDRARAVAMARNIRGVKLVYDDVQVTNEGGIGNTAEDAFIEAKLKARLLGAKGIKSINYRWQSVNGTVYLIGRARSQKELDSLLAVVKDTEDVERVVSHIEVKPVAG